MSLTPTPHVVVCFPLSSQPIIAAQKDLQQKVGRPKRTVTLLKPAVVSTATHPNPNQHVSLIIVFIRHFALVCPQALMNSAHVLLHDKIVAAIRDSTFNKRQLTDALDEIGE